MASFKLGLIKGEKGDSGAKGEKGDIGVTGDAGAIPVFTIDKVETVDPAFGASVDIDSSDIANPRLSFRIPKGVDGKDAFGDMTSAIYDPDGKKTDIYTYAEELFSNALPKSGGSVHGKISVGEMPCEESCVRNISFVTALPETAANGDLCFVVPKDYDNTLYGQGIGSVFILKEGDDEEEYVIVAKDYHKEGTVSLVRKHLVKYTEYFNHKIRDSYYNSDIDDMLESVFVRLFPTEIQKNMIAATLNSDYKRHCFLPSVKELTEMEYFKSYGIIAKTKAGVSREHYMTRDLGSGKTVSSVDNKGEIVSVSQLEKSSFRPMMVLPGDIFVENAVYKNIAVIKPVDTAGIYYYADGNWREIIHL